MKLREYFVDATTEEITERLKYLDKSLYDLHTITDETAKEGRYVVGDLADIEVIDGDITMESLHDKYDYLDSGINEDGKTNNIVQLCSIGLCAYCRMGTLYTSKSFVDSVIEGIDAYLDRADMPNEMQQYYIDVFCRGKVTYLNEFLMNKLVEYNEHENARGNGKGAYTKKKDNFIQVYDGKERDEEPDFIMPYTGPTGISRSLRGKLSAAFASILLLPALLALIYIVAVVVYFVFIK